MKKGVVLLLLISLAVMQYARTGSTDQNPYCYGDVQRDAKNERTSAFGRLYGAWSKGLRNRVVSFLDVGSFRLCCPFGRLFNRLVNDQCIVLFERLSIWDKCLDDLANE